MAPPEADKDSNAELLASLRAQTAFEHMAAAAVYAAAGLGAIHLVFAMLETLFRDGFDVIALSSALADSLGYAFIVFLGGFALAMIVFALFAALEKIPYRKRWPYFIAAVAANFIVVALLPGGFDLVAQRSILERVFFLIPGLVMAILFARSITPVWRQAERAETERSPTIVRFH